MVRERPQGGGSRSATHPAYQTARGEGRGRRGEEAALRTRLLLQPLHGSPAPPSRGPEREEGPRSEGRTERRDTQRGAETQRGGERWRERDRERGRDRDRDRGRDRGGRPASGAPGRGVESERLDKMNESAGGEGERAAGETRGQGGRRGGAEMRKIEGLGPRQSRSCRGQAGGWERPERGRPADLRVGSGPFSSPGGGGVSSGLPPQLQTFPLLLTSTWSHSHT